MVFFFFSSRRRHTRFKCDWSSDVCSSDLAGRPRTACQYQGGAKREMIVRAAYFGNTRRFVSYPLEPSIWAIADEVRHSCSLAFLADIPTSRTSLCGALGTFVPSWRSRSISISSLLGQMYIHSVRRAQKPHSKPREAHQFSRKSIRAIPSRRILLRDWG